MTINQNGVCLDYETVHVPMPPRCSMEINVAEVEGVWRFGLVVQSPIAGVSYPLRVDYEFNQANTRDAAINAAIDLIRRYLSSPRDKYGDSMIAALDKWVASQRQATFA